MKTITLGSFGPASGFRPIAARKSLGQALTQADRDHYLVAINRAVAEADEIDAWLKANPNAKLKPTDAEAAAIPSSGIIVSPYFVKWFNYQPIRQDLMAFRDRLANADPAAWASVTDLEHKTFGWVSVVDQIFGAFKADPRNLTAGKWVEGIRAPDLPTAAAAEASAAPLPLPLTILGLELPPTFLGVSTQTALIVGGLGIVGLGVALWVGFKK